MPRFSGRKNAWTGRRGRQRDLTRRNNTRESRPELVLGRVFLRAEIKKKDVGKIEGLAYWRAPLRDKEHWKRISNIAEPEWRVVKKDRFISPEEPGGTTGNKREIEYQYVHNTVYCNEVHQYTVCLDGIEDYSEYV